MSNCIYGGEPGDCITQKLIKGQKAHRCCECGDEIEKGALHEYFKGLWEGVFSTYRTCARCVNIRTDFFRGSTFTCMVEDFEEAHGFDYRDGIPADFTPCGATA